ncbi:MAG: hypothetical protein LBD79_09565 [Treponema sp.]|jgi:hypothetical protein|nr:hypothetical protein [Treponema sp.]
MKRIALMLIGTLMGSVALFGAGQSGGETAAGKDGLSTVRIFGIDKEYTVAGKSLKLSDWYNGTIPSRLWDQFTADLAKRGIKLELDLIMSDQAATTFQTLLASGRLNNYDFVVAGALSESITQSLVNQKRLYPLNKAFEEYSQGPAKEYYTNNPAGKFVMKTLTLEDGNLYWLPNTQADYYQTPSYIIGSFMSGMIRYDWLQAVGMGIPQTLDEFYNALMAFQQNDLNKNNVKDEVAQISLTGFDTGVAQWFGLGTQLVSIIDDKAVSPWYQPHVQDYITYMNRLYSAGLIRVDSEGGAMQANRIAYQNNWSAETWDEPSISVPTGAAKGYFAPFTLQALPDTSPRVWMQSGYQKDACLHFIPAGAKNKAGAVALIDYLVTQEYSDLTEYGIEGYTFTRDSAGKIQILGSNPNNVGLDVELRAAYMPCMWANYSILPRRRATDMEAELVSVVNLGYPLKRDFMVNAYNKKYGYVQDRNSLIAFSTPKETERITTISPDLTTYATELLTTLITGEKSLSNWSTYMSDLKRLGLDELISIYQTRLDRGK